MYQFVDHRHRTSLQLDGAWYGYGGSRGAISVRPANPLSDGDNGMNMLDPKSGGARRSKPERKKAKKGGRSKTTDLKKSTLKRVHRTNKKRGFEYQKVPTTEIPHPEGRRVL